MRINNKSYMLPMLLLLVDYLAIISAEYLAFFFKNMLVVSHSDLDISNVNFWIILPAIYIMFISSKQLYTRKMTFVKIMRKLFMASSYAIVSVVMVLHLSHGNGNISQVFTMFLGALSFVVLLLFRFVFKKILADVQSLQTPILVIGAGRTAELFVRGVTKELGLGYHVVGLLEDNEPVHGILDNYPILGGFNDIEKVIGETCVGHVVIAAPGLSNKELAKLVRRIQPLVKNLGVIPNLIGIPVGGVEVEDLFEEKLLMLRLKNNLARPLNKFMKLVFDYILTICGTVVISPILLAVAAWIYIDSPGPVYFKHRRIGKDGKEFDCYKFRTMCVDAQHKLDEILENNPLAREEWHKNFKLKDDPRITKSGNFLRRTSLDELPQILNVLKGEMSLVGPRPVVDEELVKYGDYLEDYLMVKPGITGMWQVSGRSNTTYEERVEMDSWYVRNWSVWLDFTLLWRTFKIVMKQEGAY